jgi:hypothetical protein
VALGLRSARSRRPVDGGVVRFRSASWSEAPQPAARNRARSVREHAVGLAERVEDQDVPGDGVGSPPTQSDVEHQPGEDGARQDGADRGHARLGPEYGIVQCRSSARLPGGQREHDRGGQRRPDNP